MQIKHLLVSAMLAPAALAATSPETVFSGFETLHNRILSVHECLKSFNGGVSQSLSCGFALYNVLMASGSSRKDLADLDSVPADQVQNYLNYYHGIRSAVADALGTASSKVETTVLILQLRQCLRNTGQQHRLSGSEDILTSPAPQLCQRKGDF